MAKAKKKILIVGGGFGGIKLALELSGVKEYVVTLLSDREDFRYYPALYRSATGGSYQGSSVPLSEIFAGKKVKIERGTAKTLDRKHKKIRTESGEEYPYDILVLALGVVTNFFGIKGLEEYAYGIKTLDEAERLKRHLHKHLTDEHKPDLNYVVIGGGPTGVELAGELPHYLRQIMKHHGIKQKNIHVDLVEASPRLLPRMPEDMSRAVEKHLTKIGVTLYLNQKVEAETADELMISGHPLKSHTVIWTSGVTNSPFFAENGFTMGEHGKVAVDDYLQAEKDIYVLGDNAPTKYSGLAQTALHDAVYVATNLKRELDKKPFYKYRPKKPIYVMPAGPRWAAVLWGDVRLYGLAGFLLRRLADLVGYHDYEPWWEASKIWLAEAKHQEECEVCAAGE